MPTMSEQILSRVAGRPVRAGDVVTANVDLVMVHDSLAPGIIRILHQELGAERVWDPQRVAVVIDHVAPAASVQTAEKQQEVRRWVRAQGIPNLFDVGRGISHPVLVEEGLAQPGMLILGSDSHSTAYGCVGAFGSGMGSTDIALALATGKTMAARAGDDCGARTRHVWLRRRPEGFGPPRCPPAPRRWRHLRRDRVARRRAAQRDGADDAGDPLD